jgi:hypothetical protein
VEKTDEPLFGLVNCQKAEVVKVCQHMELRVLHDEVDKTLLVVV